MRSGKMFIFFFLLVMMVVTTSQGQCENWKEFFKDDDGIYYYDKDSIHYPKTKKNIFGLTVRDKEIVNVWIRWVDKLGKSGEGHIVRIYCVERECMGCWGSFSDPWSKGVSGSREPIEPCSLDESLLKKVCP